MSDIHYYYKNGELHFYICKKVAFTASFPEEVALKYANKILHCDNCINVAFWNGVCLGLCANCALESGYICGPGFINHGEEFYDESTKDIPSAFNTYLKRYKDLIDIGDINIENTVYKMVDKLVLELINKHGAEKKEAIYGIADYLRSLSYNPREAISRIYDAMKIPESELYYRNWAQIWRCLITENFCYESSTSHNSPLHQHEYMEENAETNLDDKKEEFEQSQMDAQTANRLYHAREFIRSHFWGYNDHSKVLETSIVENIEKDIELDDYDDSSVNTLSSITIDNDLENNYELEIERLERYEAFGKFKMFGKRM